MSRKLFGTDGVRGVAGELLSAELALGLGRAAVQATARAREGAPRALVIRDTRESGERLEAAIAAGLASAGADVLHGGVLPTPAAPLLIGRHGFELAVVISASHNLYRDNGIKFFGSDGFKLSDELEGAIEEQLAVASNASDVGAAAGASSARIGHVSVLSTAEADYVDALQARFAGLELSQLDVLLDCANGATYRVAPDIFRRLGARVTVLHDAPDGRNINAGCGSTHVETLAAHVARGGHHVGFAFDGDGDRVLAVDRSGAIVDGDELMALIALHLRAGGRLNGGGVAVTVMTNYGFYAAMQHAGIEVATTSVGDRYVLEELRERGWSLGGEQSGHIIDTGFVPSGDGIASALLVLEALAGRDLAERDAMHKLPQRLVGVPVSDRERLAGANELQAAISHEHEALAGRGRVLVRASGTEPLVRVMVEAPSEREAEEVCARLVALVQAQLG
jgi:phosphoglucosamine mutase